MARAAGKGGRTDAGPAGHPPDGLGQPSGPVRRRADAQRSIEAILDAAIRHLGTTGDANMVEIARAAGVGRVTLYAHFPARDALVDAAVAHAIARAEAVLAGVDTGSGSAREMLGRLARSSWQILNDHRQLMVAGHRYLGAERMRALHDRALGQVESLIARGQSDGDLRTDLPRSWLVATYYALLHATAEEVNAGRLDPAETGDVVAATIISALAPPGSRPGGSPALR